MKAKRIKKKTVSSGRRTPGSTALRVTTVGNSAGVVIPRALLHHLRVEKGDTLYAVETPRGLELTAYIPDFARQMDAAEKVMRDDRDVLRKLAE